MSLKKMTLATVMTLTVLAGTVLLAALPVQGDQAGEQIRTVTEKVTPLAPSRASTAVKSTSSVCALDAPGS